MSVFDADLDVFMADGNASVTFGATTVTGWLRVADTTSGFGTQDYGDETVMGRLTEVLVKTGALPGLALDAVVTVNGTAYQVRDARDVEDGNFTKLYLG